MKYKKVLITGKTGTVGSNLDFGISAGPSKEGDLRDLEQTESIFKRILPDAVLHCAAKVGGLHLHLTEKYHLYYDNLLINTNVIECARKRGVKRVLSYLSSCVFSDLSPSPYNESNIHDGEPFLIHRPYGHAKRMLEVQSRICYEEFGLIYNCIVPTNIYGFHDNFNADNGHVVAVLIHRAHDAAKSGKDFVIWGDGNQKRDFIFSEDIAYLTQWALNEYEDKEPLIFSNSTPVRIGDVAEIIAKKFNIENRIKFDTSKPSGQKIRSLDGSKLASLTHFKFTPIDIGLSKSIDWYLENYPNVRL